MNPVLVLDNEGNLKTDLADFNIIVARNPDEGLKLAEKHNFSVVISNINDGLVFLSQIEGSAIKILISSAFIKEDDLNKAKISYCLKKPYEKEELSFILNQALDKFNNNNELEKSRFKVSRLEVIKDEISKIITHELKTPLTSINGYLNLLEDEFNEENFQGLKTSVKELNTFIEMLTELSNVKLNNVKVNKTKILLTDILAKYFIDIKTPFYYYSDAYLLEKAFDYLYKYIKDNLKIESTSYTVKNNILMINMEFLSSINQTTLFSTLETDSDIKNYKRLSSLEISYVHSVFKLLDIKFDLKNISNKLRIELVF